MLSHAFRDNYDLAVLIAGDGDYLPLIEEVKRQGKIVCAFFFSDKKHGLSEGLEMAVDRFKGIESLLLNGWEYMRHRKE